MISSQRLFKKRALRMAYCELGRIIKEVDISLDEGFIINIPTILLTENMLPEERNILLSQHETSILRLEPEFLTELVPQTNS